MAVDISRTSVLEERLVLSSGIIQEHFFNRDLEQPGDPEREFKRGIILLFFYGEDRLPGYPKLVGKNLLGKVTQGPVHFNPVLHSRCTPGAG